VIAVAIFYNDNSIFLIVKDIAGIFKLGNSLVDEASIYSLQHTIMFVLLLFVLIIVLKTIIINKYSRFYEITSDTVKAKEGIFYVKKTQINNKAIRTVSLRQTFLQMVLNIGDVEISSSDALDPVVMQNIDSYEELIEYLEVLKIN
jgi:uncharacterized membrane protein YdbT with pleckstrin-like domain